MVNGYEEWVAAEVVRQYLGENDIQTVLRLARRGRIPCVKIAGQWKFKLSLVDRALVSLARANR